MSGMHLSKEFFELLKAIGESKSKQEEDRIIAREVAGKSSEFCFLFFLFNGRSRLVQALHGGVAWHGL